MPEARDFWRAMDDAAKGYVDDGNTDRDDDKEPDDGEEAYKRLCARGEEIRRIDKSLSPQQAFANACEENPKLRDRAVAV